VKADSSLSWAKVVSSVDFLKSCKKVLFVTTSSREPGNDEIPKTSQLALKIASLAGKEKVSIIDVSKLKIYPCEGNVSSANGNSCGNKSARLSDSKKNPSGNHRCWTSIHNPDDELWKISKELFSCDCIVFFGSVRWGQTNSLYQRLIERLTWLENRHSCLGEENILKNISAGIILFGQNWRGAEVLETQKRVLDFFGFKVVNGICWNWQFTMNENDESKASYLAAAKEFKDFLKEHS